MVRLKRRRATSKGSFSLTRMVVMSLWILGFCARCLDGARNGSGLKPVLVPSGEPDARSRARCAGKYREDTRSGLPRESGPFGSGSRTRGSDGPGTGVGARPRPLQVVAAQPAGHVAHLADE